MHARRPLLAGILATAGLVSAFTSPAIAGHFPSRPPGVKLHYFTGVLTLYGLGNNTGNFALKRGARNTTFYVGLPMKMNGVTVTCPDADFAKDPDVCTDWPSEIVLGKAVVTATCWYDTTVFREPTLFCDEIDYGGYGPSAHRKNGHP